jgi:hypothetical protein
MDTYDSELCTAFSACHELASGFQGSRFRIAALLGSRRRRTAGCCRCFLIEVIGIDRDAPLATLAT